MESHHFSRSDAQCVAHHLFVKINAGSSCPGFEADADHGINGQEHQLAGLNAIGCRPLLAVRQRNERDHRSQGELTATLGKKQQVGFNTTGARPFTEDPHGEAIPPAKWMEAQDSFGPGPEKQLDVHAWFMAWHGTGEAPYGNCIMQR